MIDITAIEDALYTWVSGVLEIPVIFAYPNTPRPETPYVLINIPNVTQVGWSEADPTLLPDYSIDNDISSLNELLVSINTYYDNAYSNATVLKGSLERITVHEQLYIGGLGYSRTTAINKIPEEINKQWEERAQFDCYFLTRSLDTENLATIQKIEITNQIDGYTTIIEKQ